MSEVSTQQVFELVHPDRGLSDPRDVIKSLQEIYDTWAVEAIVRASETTASGGRVVKTDHDHTLDLHRSLDRARLFGRGPFKYDQVRFRGRRHIEQGESTPLWEHYYLDITDDDDFAVACLHAQISQIGGPRHESFKLNTFEITPAYGGKPDIAADVRAHRLFPIIRTAIMIGGEVFLDAQD